MDGGQFWDLGKAANCTVGHTQHRERSSFSDLNCILTTLESPGTVQEEAIEGLYNPPDWCFVLEYHDNHLLNIIMII